MAGCWIMIRLMDTEKLDFGWTTHGFCSGSKWRISTQDQPMSQLTSAHKVRIFVIKVTIAASLDDKCYLTDSDSRLDDAVLMLTTQSRDGLHIELLYAYITPRNDRTSTLPSSFELARELPLLDRSEFDDVKQRRTRADAGRHTEAPRH